MFYAFHAAGQACTLYAKGDDPFDSKRRRNTRENLIKSGYFWCSSIPVDTPVTIYGAVNDARGCLVNCNNYVAFFTDTGEVRTENNSTVNSKYQK